MRKLTLLCLLTLFSLSIACSRKPSDETIAQDVEKRVSADPQAQDSQVTVEAKEGKVTLKGKAKSAVARQRVEQIAQEEPWGHRGR
jgi:osmotically-inducible protein OsmY